MNWLNNSKKTDKRMYAEIVFPLAFRKSFTYQVPKELQSQAKVGVRAVAPFGKRTLTGFIVNKPKTISLKDEPKLIIDILDEKPIVDKDGFKFYEWLADYYLCSLGEALKLVIPYGSDVESKRKIISDKEASTLFFQNKKINHQLVEKL